MTGDQEPPGGSGNSQSRRAGFLGRETVTTIVVTVVCILLIEPMLHHFSAALIGGVTGLPYRVVDFWFKNVSQDPIANALLDLTKLIVTGVLVTTSVFVTDTLVRARRTFRAVAGKPDPSASSANWSEKRAKTTIIWMTIVLIVSWFLFFLSCLNVIGQKFVTVEANLTFARYEAALAPALTDQEYKQLNADWVFVDNSAKYHALLKRMEDTAAARHVPMPKRLL